MTHTLAWLRTDLRLHDNPALSAAAADGTVTALYMPAPGQWRAHAEAPVKVDFWLRCLHALKKELDERHIALRLLPVEDWRESAATLVAWCKQHEVRAVHANAEWGINEQRRDAMVAEALADAGIDFTLHHGGTLLVPGTVLTGKGDTYKVFTPYARACRARLQGAVPQAVRAPRAQARAALASDALPAHFPGYETPPEPLRALWPAGEAAAHDRLRDFLDGEIEAYHDARDFPAERGTSMLSPYLAAGVVSAAQCLRAALSANQGELDSGKLGPRTWITELLWREFYQHLLAASPGLSMHQPMRPETVYLQWRDAPDDLEAWQMGRTGIPIVDAAQRQLLATGWMHNRLRMVSAMFLTKNLLIDWRLGETWFMAHLIDGDLAANNGGWQWSASTGADAAPYFRVFNPVSQSRKFDAKGVFLRRWLPELADLDNDSLHEPSAAQRRAAGYPEAIVDLKSSRVRAIEAFAALPRVLPG
ncbi:deoxyribodipyrimidine photo-lyase [Bordetella genomosp. 1]|uniref:Deoxyribodipyrimidine photo-lyase n=1 Tax=Bordetella genomosp. 1 TaxID=1395607 RepID=A0ABX4EXF6_9BORD|nr:deoxyribodipyrimidine photo-lyase [Bordetella genomosp. 1]OZI63763.1 deoxyribodipyrimidine photo-lyase [Bordetella genomosp. 1]